MRRLLLFLAVVPAFAEEGGAGGDDARLERLAMARLAFDARLKLGDLLRDEGRAKDALAEYARAVAIFQSALDAAAPQFGVAVRGAVGAPPRGRGGRRAAPETHVVELGLTWLADHQDSGADGRWDARGFMKHDPAEDRCDGDGRAAHDVAVTGLATLAFLGAGYTDRGSAEENRHAKGVREGLRFLLQSQDAEGCFGARDSPHALLGHALATLAMSEAYGMTRNPRYRAPAESGAAFLVKARNKGGGWGRDDDLLLTAWCLTALKSVPSVDTPWKEIDDAVLSLADRRTDAAGRVATPPWRPGALAAPAETTETATAAALWIRILAGQDPATTDVIRRGAKACAAKPPRWNPDDGSIDMHYWFFGTHALFRCGGEEWRAWSAAMEDAIVARQHKQGSGSRTGSWDPLDQWGLAEGGRVHSTALMTTCLEVYYRYDRALGARAAEERPR